MELVKRPTGNEVIVGCGVNVAITDAEQSQIGQPVADLRRYGVTATRTDLAVKMVEELLLHLQVFEADGFKPFMEQFNDLHVYQGQTCNLLMENRTQTGRVVGVGEQGELLLETANGVHKFLSGEVSLRAA